MIKYREPLNRSERCVRTSSDGKKLHLRPLDVSPVGWVEEVLAWGPATEEDYELSLQEKVWTNIEYYTGNDTCIFCDKDITTKVEDRGIFCSKRCGEEFQSGAVGGLEG